MEKKDLNVGQTVYIKPTGNASRRNKEIKTGKIEYIGAKYFEVEGFRNRFLIETGAMDCTPYISDGVAYLTLQEIEDENELRKGIDNIKANAHRLSLEQVRACLSIFGVKKDL